MKLFNRCLAFLGGTAACHDTRKGRNHFISKKDVEARHVSYAHL